MNTPFLTTKLYMPPLRQELVRRHRQVSAVFSLFNFAFQMLTGMFIPLQILPATLRELGIVAFAQILGMDLLRAYLMGTQTLMAAPSE
jgi:ABC-type multidrug transport system permease subunit